MLNLLSKLKLQRTSVCKEQLKASLAIFASIKIVMRVHQRVLLRIKTYILLNKVKVFLNK